jgi:hypothetical protein
MVGSRDCETVRGYDPETPWGADAMLVKADAEHISSDPTRDVGMLKVKTAGFPSWRITSLYPSPALRSLLSTASVA